MLKNKIHYIYIIIVTFLLASCAGEDRTYQYEELTQHNHWVYELMSKEYLWADKLTEPTWKSFFGSPTDFLAKLKKNGSNDDWSYITVDTITTYDPHSRGYFCHYDSYGFDYTLISDPTGQTTKQYVRVLTVYPNSTAEKCGLSRGDIIISFDNFKFSTKNVSKLQNGPERTLKVCHLASSGNTYNWVDTVDVRISASSKVEDVAFVASSVYSYKGIDIGYLMCNRLLEGNSSDDMSYKSKLDEIMAAFSNQQISELILDLRLCNDGNLTMVQRLASYLVSASDRKCAFLKKVYGSIKSNAEEEVPFDSSIQGLGIGRIFIITSGYTQGAAEWLIQGLCNVWGRENIIIIGEKTAGQNVLLSHFRSDSYLLDLYPAVAYVASPDGDYNYSDGFTPDYSISEYNSLYLAPYGNRDETLLSVAMEIIVQ